MNLKKSKVLLASSLVLGLMTAYQPAYSDGSASSYQDHLGPAAQQNVQILKSLIQQYNIDANQLDNISHDLGVSLSDLRALQSEENQVLNNLQRLKSERRQLRDQIQDEQDELIQKERKLTQVTQKLQNLRQQKQQKKSQVQAEQKRIAPIQKQLQQAKTKKSQLQTKLSKLTQEKTQLQRQIAADQKKVNAAKTKLQKNKSNVPVYKKQIATAEANIQKANKEAAAIQTQINQKQQKINELKQELKTLPPRDPRRRQIMAQVRSLGTQKTKLTRLKQNKTMVAKRNQKLKNSTQKKLRTIKLENMRLKKDIQVAQTRIDSYSQQVTQKTKRIASVRPKLQKANQELQTAKTRYQAASRKLNQLQAQLDDIKSKLQDKRQRKTKLENRIARLDQSILSKKQSLVRKRQRIQNLRVQKDQLASQISRTQATVRSLENQESRVLSKLENASTSSHNGKLLHVVVGATRDLGSKTSSDINLALSSGAKVTFWVQGDISSSLASQYGHLMGVDSAQLEHTSDLQGESVLSGLQITRDSEHMVLNISSSPVALMTSASNQVVVSANIVSSSVVITSGLDPMKVADAKLAKMMRKIKRAHIDDFVGGDIPGEEPSPVDPPVSQVKTIQLDNLATEIPDNNSEGVEEKILVDVDSSLSIEAIELDVSIAHTYIGDLKVELIHPSGKSIVLHSNQGGGADSLQLSLNSEQLSELIGLQAAGKYSLVVVDSAARDTGIIESITMKLSMK